MRYAFGCLVFDSALRTVFKDGTSSRVTPKAGAVLEMLIASAGQTVSTVDLLDRLWPHDIGVSSVTESIKLLRKALGDSARNPRFIASEYGHGYRFISAVCTVGSYEHNGDSDIELLEARYLLARRRPSDLRKCAEQFSRIARHGNRAALLGLAEAHTTMASHLLTEPSSAFNRATALAQRALRARADYPRAYAILAHVAFFSNHNPEEASALCSKALSFDPSDTLAIRVLGRIAMASGHWDTARDYLSRELLHDATSHDAMTMFGVIQQYERRPTEAAATLERICELDASNLQAQYYLGTCLIEAGLAQDAIPVLRRVTKSDRSPANIAALGRAYAAAGRLDAARRHLRALERQHRTTPYVLAGLQAALGESDAAKESLKEARHRRDPWLPFFGVEPRFDPIRH